MFLQRAVPARLFFFGVFPRGTVLQKAECPCGFLSHAAGGETFYRPVPV